MTITHNRLFAIAALSAFLSSLSLLFVTTSMDFPNSSNLELLKWSLLPSLPAALLCGAVTRLSLYRGLFADEREWSVFGLLALSLASALVGVTLTYVGAVIYGILGWIGAPL